LPADTPLTALVAGTLAHDRRALARLLTALEDPPVGAGAALHALYDARGHATCIGVTGQPGAGKSTLVAALTLELRRRGQSVGILAIDPSSPLTHGALLGDRVRMQALAGDPGVFIRSLATRGGHGALATGLLDALAALDAFGMDVVLIETVGAGQDEVDIATVADTVVVVEIPGAGDGIQAIKAGILEVADVYAVNKADLPGADATAAHLRFALGLAPAGDWSPPVLLTVASTGAGVPELAEAIATHGRHLAATGAGERRRRARARFHVTTLAERVALRNLHRHWAETGALDRAAATVTAGEADPHEAAHRLLGEPLA